MLFPGNAAVAEAQGRILGLPATATRRSIRSDRLTRPLRIQPAYQRYLGALIAAKRLPEARSVVQARLDKDTGNRALKQQLIRLDAEIGGVEAGISKAKAFAKEDPDSSVYDLTAADLYARAGKRPEAVALLEKSAAAHPNDSAIAVGLARLYAAGGDSAKPKRWSPRASRRTRTISRCGGRWLISTC